MNDNFDPNQFLKQMGSLPEIMQRISRLAEYIGHLEQGILNLQVEAHGQKLMNNLLFNILIEANILNKEKLPDLINEHVEKPMQAYINDLNEKIQANATQIQERVNQAVEELKEEDPEEETFDTSNVVLASERFNKERNGTDKQKP